MDNYIILNHYYFIYKNSFLKLKVVQHRVYKLKVYPKLTPK